MTSTQILVIGKQLLGIYFLVNGLSHLVGTLQLFGMVWDTGISRSVVAAVTVLQGTVFVLAGIILLRGKRDPDADAGAMPMPMPLEASANFVQPTLQLLGVYFFVEGLWNLVRPVERLIMGGYEWVIFGSDVLVASVVLGLGAVLIGGSSRVAELLKTFRSATTAG
jgi:hypothetical protein